MTTSRVSRYTQPQRWLRYDVSAIAGLLVEAKTAAGVLRQMPYLPQWIEQAHEAQLRLEAAGTTRIEGAVFTPQEQAQALDPATVTAALNHSQRQLRSANDAYHWLRSLPVDRPVSPQLILDLHRRIVTGCDDDHCEPGALRRAGSNVTFGLPPCRGVEGGEDAAAAFESLCQAIAGEFPAHDRIIQAMAAHYHVGAMHPFDDGNGRTARALEAFMLREAGVNDMVMVSLSNYYHEYKDRYLAALYESRRRGHDLTPFLAFALPAVTERCNALTREVTAHTKRLLFREFAQTLFNRLRTRRRRALAERQLRILDLLLDAGPLPALEFVRQSMSYYWNLKYPERGFERDIAALVSLFAVVLRDDHVYVNLDWPQQFSESELLEMYENMPSAAGAGHPAMPELSRLLGRRR